jgi:large subunit ribosomal protein L29
MPLPKIEDARKLNDEELGEQISATKRELFDLRFQKATRQLEKTHQFKHARHRLAQLMTVERERQLDQKAESQAGSSADS